MRVAVAALAAVTSLLAVSAPAHAAAKGPIGLGCGLALVRGVDTDGWVHTGVVFGGPLVSVGTAPPSVDDGLMTCTVQVGGNDTHAEADSDSASGAGTGLTVVPPTLATFWSPRGAAIWLCTQFTYFDSGTTLYRDADNDTDPTTTGRWTTDANAQCARATYVNPKRDFADPLTCPWLATVSPPTGDVPGLWDCPPYDENDDPVEMAGGYVVVPEVITG